VSDDGWMLIDTESGNVVDWTDDPLVAGEFWRLALDDETLALGPDIDCEGDCCASGECRFGLSGGPSCFTPEGM
jgi:hypothetical protein